ncbi:hypothetical protein DFS34DRAFT_299919 [Phlyctochytrium arcticum]|nr:hypothetical protein DFS34DRAFT_299919 [Phlyctochytrium arcticum]
MADPPTELISTVTESVNRSQPIRLRHGDVLTIGSSVLVAHIHTGLGCDECRMTATNVVALETKKSEKPSAVEVGGEDYINPASIGLSRNGGGGGGQQPKKAELETARLEELKRLKRDALGEEEEETEVSSDKPKKKKKKRKMKEGYIDRAAMRRHMFGPEHTGGGEEHHRPSSSQHQPYETAASHDVAITAVDPTNIGSKLLQKMGWSQGQGLGVSGSGRVDPVNVSMRNGREGLGTAGSSSAPPPSGKRETLYEATMRKARERFSEM